MTVFNKTEYLAQLWPAFLYDLADRGLPLPKTQPFVDLMVDHIKPGSYHTEAVPRAMVDDLSAAWPPVFDILAAAGAADLPSRNVPRASYIDPNDFMEVLALHWSLLHHRKEAYMLLRALVPFALWEDSDYAAVVSCCRNVFLDAMGIDNVTIFC